MTSINTLTQEQRAKTNIAWRHMLRHGFAPREQRDIISTDATGASIVSQDFNTSFTDALKFYGPIAALVKRKDAYDGRPMKWVVTDDTASTMTYVPETGATSSIEADPTIQSDVTGTSSLVTVVKYSLQLLDDAFDLQSFLTDVAGLRVARAVEHALTLGKDNGSNTQLPAVSTGGLLAGVSGAVTGSTIATTLTYANLAALAGSVDHAYYVNGAYMASPSVFNYLLGILDSTGRPLYPIDPSTGLMMIAGKPLYVNAAMPAASAVSSPVVLFGSFQHQFAYLNGGGVRIRVLTERFADLHEGAALIYHRLGGTNLLSNAVKALLTPAS